MSIQNCISGSGGASASWGWSQERGRHNREDFSKGKNQLFTNFDNLGLWLGPGGNQSGVVFTKWLLFLIQTCTRFERFLAIKERATIETTFRWLSHNANKTF